MNSMQLNNIYQGANTLTSSHSKATQHESSTNNKLKALILGCLAINGAAATSTTNPDTCTLDDLPNPCYNSWPLTNTFSAIPFTSEEYRNIDKLNADRLLNICYQESKFSPAPWESEKVCRDERKERDKAPPLQNLFEDLAYLETKYQSATKGFTAECEFWKNIITTLTDQNCELFQLDTQSVSWKLSLSPDATDINGKVKVFRNGVPDYCLNSTPLPLEGHHECADLSFAESHAASFKSLNPSAIKKEMGNEFLHPLYLSLLHDNVHGIKGSVELEELHKHEKAIQSIFRAIAQSKKEIIECIRNACASHRKVASEKGLQILANEEQTSWVVLHQNGNVIYSFTLDHKVASKDTIKFWWNKEKSSVDFTDQNDNVIYSFALDLKVVSKKALKFRSTNEEQTSWVITDQNDNVIHSFTLER